MHLGEPGRRMADREDAPGPKRPAVHLDDVAAPVHVLAVVVAGEDDDCPA